LKFLALASLKSSISPGRKAEAAEGGGLDEFA
jgi:hypothetical protein